jgi:hypothetical protein
MLLAVGAFAQEPVPALSTADIPGVSIVRATTYEGKALYGYIDGGAELSFEYGFRRAVVQDILQDSRLVHLEVHEMDSREGAAGFFSVSVQGCAREAPWEFTCASRFQIQAARGRYFIRAANASGTPGEEALMRKVASAVMAKIGDSTYSPPPLFLDSLFQRGQRTFMMARGPLGIQNGLDEWASLVEGTEEFRLSVLAQESEGVTSKIALLETRLDGGKIATIDRWKERAPAGFLRLVVADGARRYFLLEINADQKTAGIYRATIERYRTSR